MEIEKIAILDCGGQYTKVIDRKVRELYVKSDIFPIKINADELKTYQGLIISGSPSSVWTENSLIYDKEIFNLNIPILGICYGLHLINIHYHGTVKPGIKNEYGETVININSDCALFKGLALEQKVLMSHGDSIQQIAAGFKIGASSGSIPAAIYNNDLKIYGVQFHPEVDLTINGKEILKNFVTNICRIKCNYTLDNRVENAIKMIQERVGNNKVLVLVSGGVDSAVSAALLLKALPKSQIYAIHVDHGFMRKNESDTICKNLDNLGLKNIIRINARDTFLHKAFIIDAKKHTPLSAVSDPEEKRNIIGHAFIEVVKDAVDKIAIDFDHTFLAQGTLRPDLIESGNPDVSKYAHKIKTHHNDVPVIRKAREKGLVIETNWDWHKDEVRQVARKLGINEDIASRQPFPGPGLAIRIICASESKTINEEHNILLKKLLNDLNSDYSGIVIPVNSVGVQGDCRSYKYLSIISGKGMNIKWDDLYTLGTAIPNKLNYINRVAYILNKEYVHNLNNYPLFINETNLDLLSEIDYIVRKYLDKKPISQVFAVLLPVGLEKKLSVAIRAFITNDFMTGRPAIIDKEISKQDLEKVVYEIAHNFKEIDLILYDITSKPPATVEWE